MNSKIYIIFNVIQQVNTSLRISWETAGQLSYLKAIDLEQYSLYGGWYTQVKAYFKNIEHFNCSLDFHLTY